MTYSHIKIEQLDASGSVYRSFNQYPARYEIEERLVNIRRAYNLDRTTVTLDGEVVRLTR